MLSPNEARRAANQIVWLLRQGYWKEDIHGTYLAGVYGMPYDLAIWINYGILERWESSLTHHQRYEWRAMCERSNNLVPWIRNSNQNGFYFSRNYQLKSGPILAESFAHTLYALEKLESGQIVKLHWLLVQMQMELVKEGV